MRDLLSSVGPIVVPAFDRSDDRRPAAGNPWPAKAAPEHATSKAAPAAAALAKRARPTSSFEGFGSFSG